MEIKKKARFHATKATWDLQKGLTSIVRSSPMDSVLVEFRFFLYRRRTVKSDVICLRHHISVVESDFLGGI